ncbi:MAG TPA: hypothetical protein VKM54_08845 [Myxococcota bacterium]|nr:hypothetical protein [Myxococcota bacterium]
MVGVAALEVEGQAGLGAGKTASEAEHDLVEVAVLARAQRLQEGAVGPQIDLAERVVRQRLRVVRDEAGVVLLLAVRAVREHRARRGEGRGADAVTEGFEPAVVAARNGHGVRHGPRAVVGTCLTPGERQRPEGHGASA